MVILINTDLIKKWTWPQTVLIKIRQCVKVLYFKFEGDSLLLVASVDSSVTTTPCKVDPGLNCTMIGFVPTSSNLMAH